MGCDIHFYVERRVDGVWQSADNWVEEYEDEGLTVPLKNRFYDGRSYPLFGILAGVRRPQAGDPVATPGVPEDACPEYKAHVERWDCDGHSHSHFTLAEFLAYDWTQEAQFEGWIGLGEWVRARDDSDGPDSYCAGIGGGGVTHHDMAAFEAAWQTVRQENDWPESTNPRWKVNPNNQGDPVIVRMTQLLGGTPYCLFKWSVPYYKSARFFWSDTVPRLLSLGAPEDVRCVFFFDN